MGNFYRKMLTETLHLRLIRCYRHYVCVSGPHYTAVYRKFWSNVVLREKPNLQSGKVQEIDPERHE